MSLIEMLTTDFLILKCVFDDPGSIYHPLLVLPWFIGKGCINLPHFLAYTDLYGRCFGVYSGLFCLFSHDKDFGQAYRKFIRLETTATPPSRNVRLVSWLSLTA